MTPCTEWPGARNRGGYGRIGRGYLAHRVAWMFVNGPIPVGMFVLHRWDNPPCVNVEHLFLGTHVDNMRDMAQKGRATRWCLTVTECPKGHPYDEANTYRRPDGGRDCRKCRRFYSRRYEATVRNAVNRR